MSNKAKLYIVLTALAGITALKAGLDPWKSDDFVRFICYFLISTMASGCKVSLPGVTGTMSVNFLFILIGIVELSLPETMLIGFAATIFQSFWRSKTRPMPVQILFNVANVAITTMASFYAYHLPIRNLGFQFPLLLVLAACVYFVTNTFSVAIVISLTEGKRLGKVWKECYFWSFPYYLAGAAIAGLLSAVNHFVGWQTSLLVFPVIYWIYRSYRLYLGRHAHREQIFAAVPPSRVNGDFREQAHLGPDRFRWVARQEDLGRNLPVQLAVAVCTFFLLNTGMVSLVLSLIEKQPLQKVWRQCYLWSFPYYLVGAAIACAITICGRTVGWKSSLLILPLMYMIYSFYRLYLLQLAERDSAALIPT